MAMGQDIGRLGRIKAVVKVALQTGKATANEMEDLVGGNALREEARRMFDIADADGSGAINMQEFRGAYEAITHKSLPRDQVEEIFRMIDTSGDNSVSFEEFYEWVKKQRSVPLHLRKPRIVGFLESFFTPQDDSFKVALREKQAVGELRAAAKGSSPRTRSSTSLILSAPPRRAALSSSSGTYPSPARWPGWRSNLTRRRRRRQPRQSPAPPGLRRNKEK